ncbi:hypothetical protein [Methylopila sp. M107]|uniref:hypothetical protein n=1 Tax=Methylopila sp. M107 TaxID=1101190 RepID=UPI00037D83EB|nr:hypothetical protein [Methylopila sp. M107]
MNDEEAQKLVANERAKLTATYLNSIAAGLLIIGVVGPIFSFMFAGQTTRPSVAVLGLGIVICQMASGSLHLLEGA